MGSIGQQRHKKREWTPRLKQAAAVAARASDSASAHSADLALLSMKKIGRRREAGVEMDHAVVASMAGVSTSGRSPAKKQELRKRRVVAPTMVLAIVLGLSAPAVVGALLASGGFRPSGYSVDGTVMFRGRPLGDAMLCFHPGDSAPSCMSATTTVDGRFAVAGLPEGRYRVAVRSLGESDAGIPATYSRSETTRFEMTVTKDLAALTLFVETK